MKTLRQQNFKLWTGIIVLLLLSFVVSDAAWAGETWNRISLGAKTTIGNAVGGRIGSSIKSTNFGIGSAIGKRIDNTYSTLSTVKAGISTSATSASNFAKSYIPSYVTSSPLSGIRSGLTGLGGALGGLGQAIGAQLSQFTKFSAAFNTKSMSTITLNSAIGQESNTLSINNKAGVSGISSSTFKAGTGNFQLQNNGNNNLNRAKMNIPK